MTKPISPLPSETTAPRLVAKNDGLVARNLGKQYKKRPVVRGDRGVYSAQTGMARLLGDVRITRGDNQINGREAIVNMRTGVARLVSSPGARVQGLIVPNQQDGAAEKPGATQQQQPAPGAGSVRIGR